MTLSAIEIEIKGREELQRKMTQMVRDLHGTPILNAMRDSTLLVQRKARQNAPVDTGRLRASINPEIRMDANDVQGVVGSNVVYAPDQEFGTKPHGIWSRSPFGVLAFEWKDGPTYTRSDGTTYKPTIYFFRSVTHPGTKGKRYLQRAFESSELAINRRFERAMNEVIEK